MLLWIKHVSVVLKQWVKTVMHYQLLNMFDFDLINFW